MNLGKRLMTATAAVLAVFVTVGMCGCSALSTPTIEEAQSSNTTSAKVSSPVINTDGYLTVGLLSGETAPLLITSDGNTVSGIDVDVASALADQLGLKVRFVSLTNVGEADTAGCDIVMGVQSGDSDEVSVVGSYAERGTAFFHQGSEATVSVSDLEGKTVALQAGSASERALGRTGISMTQKTYSNLNDAFAALETGEVDYVLCDAYAGAYLATAYDDISVAGTIDVPSSIGVGLLSGNLELQSDVTTALDAVTTNGQLGLIRNRWVGSMSALTAQSQIQNVPAASTESTDTSTDATATDTTTTDEAA